MLWPRTPSPFEGKAKAMSSLNHTTIRDMVEDDLRGVMRIEMVSFPDPWAPLAFVSDLRYNERARYRVFAAEDGSIVGYIGWWNMPDHVSVLKLAVDAACRRQGVAGKLMEEAVRSCADQGLSIVQLFVRASNSPAISFYHSMGFQAVETLDGYYPDGEGALSMYCPVSSFDLAREHMLELDSMEEKR